MQISRVRPGPGPGHNMGRDPGASPGAANTALMPGAVLSSGLQEDQETKARLRDWRED